MIIFTYWRSGETLQTSEASVSLLASLSMVTQVTLISSRPLGSLSYKRFRVFHNYGHEMMKIAFTAVLH